ncbi:HesA/MoeB/ThiF family protein, partial [Proteus mirabilis]
IAKQALLALNPDIKITTYKQRVNDDFLSTLLQNIDLVLDCTDNMSTRQAINRICVKQQIPLISGSAVGFSG